MDSVSIETAAKDTIRKLAISSLMNLKLAKALIDQVEEEAKRMGLRVVIAVSDSSGRPVAIHCMDGAYIGSFDIALNKTYTAIAFQMPTVELGRLAAPGGSLYGIQNTNDGKVVLLGGGEQLIIDGVVIGAIGVSGGSNEEDTALGAYGKKIVKDVISWK